MHLSGAQPVPAGAGGTRAGEGSLICPSVGMQPVLETSQVTGHEGLVQPRPLHRWPKGVQAGARRECHVPGMCSSETWPVRLGLPANAAGAVLGNVPTDCAILTCCPPGEHVAAAGSTPRAEPGFACGGDHPRAARLEGDPVAGWRRHRLIPEQFHSCCPQALPGPAREALAAGGLALSQCTRRPSAWLEAQRVSIRTAVECYTDGMAQHPSVHRVGVSTAAPAPPGSLHGFPVTVACSSEAVPGVSLLPFHSVVRS